MQRDLFPPPLPRSKMNHWLSRSRAREFSPNCVPLRVSAVRGERFRDPDLINVGLNVDLIVPLI